MEKTKHVRCVPEDMVDRLKKLLVRLWETRNPASNYLSAILSDFEVDTRSLNEAMLDISLKERSAALKENEKNCAVEKEKLQAELERISEEIRASAAVRVEKIKASFVCEKAELDKGFTEKRRELEKEFAERSARQAEELSAKEEYLAAARAEMKELEGRMAELKDEHHAELLGKMLEKESEFRSRLEEFSKEKAAHIKAIEELKSGFESEKGVLEAERERLRAELGGRYAELEAGLKASLGGRAAELERDYAARRDALAGELRGKEAELNREAAGRIEFERATWEAQSKRQESLLAGIGGDFKKAQKEIENLAAENRRVSENLVEKERELERRLFEAKTEHEGESGRRIQEAVEAETGRLLESLKTAEKKREEAEAEAARTKEESCRLKAELLERARQFEERVAREGEEALARRVTEAEGAYKEEKVQFETAIAAEKAGLKKEFEERSARQAEELAAKEQYLAAAHGEMKELEKRMAGMKDEHHAELMGRMLEKESEFRSRLEEFGKEKVAYVKSIEELKSGFESEKGVLEAERDRIKAELGGRSAGLEAGLRASLNERSTELERDYAARREALAGELRGKEAELNREAAGRIEVSRATWEAQSRRQESLLAGLGGDFRRAQQEIEELTAENRRLSGNFAEKAELKREFEERSARQAEEMVLKEQYLAAAQVKVKELEKQMAGLNDAHHAELMAKLREKESEFRSRLEEFTKEKAAYVKAIEELKAGFESEKRGLEAERDHIKAEAERDYAARREALTGELRGKEAELNREAVERIEFERTTWEAQSKRQESLLAGISGDFKNAQKEIENLTAGNRRVSEIVAEKEREFQLKTEAQLTEALARERERLTTDFARRRAALETAVKERLAAFEEKEKSWSVEKERYNTELELAAAEARAFVAERAQKMKSDSAKWKEALEKEYKEKIAGSLEALTFERDRLAEEAGSLKTGYTGLVKRAAQLETELAGARQESHEQSLRLTEQLRAKDVLLISEKGRLDTEFIEKHAAMEARFESLKTEFELKDNKLRQNEKKAVAEKEALAAEFSTRLELCENELAEWKSRAESSGKKLAEAFKNMVESDTALKAKRAELAGLRDTFAQNGSRLAAEHAAGLEACEERAVKKEAEMRALLEEKNKNLEDRRKTLESEYAARTRQLVLDEKTLESGFNDKKAGLIRTVDKIKTDLERREAALKKREDGLSKE